MEAFPNSAQYLDDVQGIDNITDVGFLRLLLKDGNGTVLSRNVYWLTAQNDVLNWTNSSWYSTPVTEFADMTALFGMENTSLSVSVSGGSQQANMSTTRVEIENQSGIPAFFIRLTLVDAVGNEVLPAFWTDNYITLFPKETLTVHASWESDMQAENILISGVNVVQQNIAVA